jgi:hypothetical protein
MTTGLARYFGGRETCRCRLQWQKRGVIIYPHKPNWRFAPWFSVSVRAPPPFTWTGLCVVAELSRNGLTAASVPCIVSRLEDPKSSRVHPWWRERARKRLREKAARRSTTQDIPGSNKSRRYLTIAVVSVAYVRHRHDLSVGRGTTKERVKVARPWLCQRRCCWRFERRLTHIDARGNEIHDLVLRLVELVNGCY